MTLKDAQIQGYLITEREMKNLESLILDQYKEADKLISARLRKLFDQLQDGGIKPGDQYNWLIQYDRNIKLRQDITAAYTAADQSAYSLTVQSGKLGVNNNYYRQFYMVEFQEPLSFSLLNQDLVNYAVTGQVESWKALSEANKARFLNPSAWPPAGTLLDVFRKNRTDTLRQLQAIINSGMMAGDSYAKISRRVGDAIGKVTDGKASGQLAKALRIVRTEGSRALNAGSYASTLTANDLGIAMIRMWDATLDSLTRPAHASADGQTVKVDEPFIVGGEKLMFPGDSSGSPENIINERCTTLDLVDGQVPEARRGRDPVTGESSVFSYKNFDQWAKEKGLTKNKYGMLYAS